MHEHQKTRRIAAARSFMESLDQLHNILAQESQSAEFESQPEESCESSSWNYPQALEEAAADLDEYFGDAQPPEEGVLGES